MKNLLPTLIVVLFVFNIVLANQPTKRIRNLEPAARVNEIYIKTASGYDTIRFANTAAGQLIRLNDAGVWEAWTPNYLEDADSLGFIMWGKVDISTTSISVTYPTPMPSANYLHDVKIDYDVSIDGHTGKVPNPAWGFEFTETGFSGNVKYPTGTLTWYVVRENQNIATVNWTETDPLFMNSTARGITDADTATWNAKPSDYEMRKAIKDSILAALTFEKDTSSLGVSRWRFTAEVMAIPETSSSPGLPGTVIASPMYIYFCVAENTWRVMTLSEFSNLANQ